MKRIKEFLNCADINDEKKLKGRKTLFGLIIDFSVIPQVLPALWFYRNLTVDSVVLLAKGLQPAFLAAFSGIVIFALLCIIKRLYPLRILLIAAYLQLIITIVANRFYKEIPIYGRSLRYNSTTMHSNWIIVYAVCGIIIALINITALYGYKKIKERESKA